MAYEGFDGWSGLTDKERSDLADMDRVSIALGGEGVLGQLGLDTLAADDSSSRPATSAGTEVAIGVFSDGDQPVSPPAPNEESSMKPEKIDDPTQIDVTELKDALSRLEPGDIEKIAPLDPTRDSLIDLDRDDPEVPPSALDATFTRVQGLFRGATRELDNAVKGLTGKGLIQPPPPPSFFGPLRGDNLNKGGKQQVSMLGTDSRKPSLLGD